MQKYYAEKILADLQKEAEWDTMFTSSESQKMADKVTEDRKQSKGVMMEINTL